MNTDIHHIRRVPWTAQHIAEYMHITRKTVLNNIQHLPQFPRPLKGSSRPLLWDRDAVISFLYSNQ